MAGNGASTMLELALSFERADPNIPDNEGNTPLHFAAQAGKLSMSFQRKGNVSFSRLRNEEIRENIDRGNLSRTEMLALHLRVLTTCDRKNPATWWI